MILFMLFMWAVMCYLIGAVAFREGRKSKWEEMSREYICIHKSVLISQNRIDKKHKKCYHKHTTRNP